MDGSSKYVVRLTAEARERLDAITRNGSAPAKRIRHARVLLMSDQHHAAGRYHDHEIAAALGIHVNSVAHIRKRFVLQGEQPALDRKPRPSPPVPPKLDGHAEAQLVAICCSPPPDGRVRWTLSLLQQEVVGRQIVTSIGCETIRKTLKKTRCSRGASSASAFPNATRRVSSRRWSRCWTSMPARRRRTSR
jgi:transposase